MSYIALLTNIDYSYVSTIQTTVDIGTSLSTYTDDLEYTLPDGTKWHPTTCKYTGGTNQDLAYWTQLRSEIYNAGIRIQFSNAKKYSAFKKVYDPDKIHILIGSSLDPLDTTQTLYDITPYCGYYAMYPTASNASYRFGWDSTNSNYNPYWEYIRDNLSDIYTAWGNAKYDETKYYTLFVYYGDISTTTTYNVTTDLTNITADSSNPTTIEENTEFTLKFSANTGYQITNLTSNIGTVTIADDKLSATVAGTATEDITVSGTAEIMTFTVIQNLTNVTSNNTTATVEYGTLWSAEFTPATGYLIDTAESNIGTWYKESSKQYATVAITVTENVTITVIAVKDTKYYTVTSNLTNITADSSNPTTVEENTEFALKFNANDGYQITSLTSNIGTVTIADDKLSATIAGTATENITVTGTAEMIYYIHITGTFTNCSCNCVDGEIVDASKTVYITADDGYTFGSSIFEYRDSGRTIQFGGSDSTVIGFTPKGTGDVYLFDTYKATKIVEHVSAFVNLYRCTNDTLKALSQVRFVDDSDSTIDYGQYITALFRTNIDIDSIMSGDTASIILGTYDSKVDAETPSTYKFEIELGTITVPEKYGNVYDYINTSITLYVPFFSAISLNVADIVGKTVTIKLIFDLYNGTLTLLVYDADGNVLHTATNTIVTNIPYISEYKGTLINQLSTVYVQADDHTNARIKVTRNIPYDVDSIFGKEVIEFGTIGDYSGYIECSDCKINTNATSDELDSIISLLKGGVYIGS